MTKFKKITGIALAGCMALSSLMMTAGAAEVPAQALADSMKLSENAGKTMMVNVVNADISGSYDQQVIEVNIPEGATVQQEKQAVTAAATKAAGREISVSRAAIAGDVLGSDSGVTVTPNTGSATTTELCRGRARKDYEVLVVYMKANEGATAKKLNVRVWTSAIGVTYGEDNAVYSLNNPLSSTCTVMFVNGKVAGRDKFWIANGDTVIAYGSTVSGTCTLTTTLYGQV